MTTEERAELILKPYHKDCAPIWNDLERDIAAAIRDAVAEGTKDARNATGMENWRLRAIQAEALNAIYQTKLDTMREQARDALAPFARLADERDGTDEMCLIQVMASELHAARDAYLALGGKIE